MKDVAVLRGVTVAQGTVQLPAWQGVARTQKAPLAEPADAGHAALPDAIDVARLQQAAYDRGWAEGQASAKADMEAQQAALEKAGAAKAEAARQAAHEAGWEAGLQEAREASDRRLSELEVVAQAATDERLAALGVLLKQGQDAWRDRVNDLEDDAVALCHAVVCKMLGAAVGSEQGTRALVQLALSELGGAAQTVWIHPADLQALGDDRERIFGTINWQADERIELGGVRVAGPGASLDATLATQLEALRSHLLRQRAARLGEESGS